MTSERMKDWIVKTSKNVLIDGVLYEPRVYTDTFTLTSANQNIVAGTPNIFVNGEQFPVILKWLTAYPILGTCESGPRLQEPAPKAPQAPGCTCLPDPRLIQRVGMRVKYHDQYYMSRTFAPVPLWHNTQTATPAYEAPSTSAWDFDMPVVLSSRDSLAVTVASLVAGETCTPVVRVEVGFHGLGLLSQRPYFLQGTIDLSSTVQTTLSTTFFRNDGSEPIVLMGAVIAQTLASGDVGTTLPLSTLNVQIRQVGNGTNANWVQAPVTQNGRVPAVLLGQKAGFSVVHELPGEGWNWRPGEGVEIDMQNLGIPPLTPAQEQPQEQIITVGVAIVGYIAVQ
jgi:hypothetical protein